MPSESSITTAGHQSRWQASASWQAGPYVPELDRAGTEAEQQPHRPKAPPEDRGKEAGTGHEDGLSKATSVPNQL